MPSRPFAFVAYFLARGFKGHAALMVLLLAVNTSIETSQTFVLGQLVNGLSGVPTAIGGLGPVGWFAALIGTWLGGYLSAHAYATFTNYTQMAMRVRIHDALFAYLMGHAPRYFLDQASGALAQKIRTTAAAAAAMVEYLCTNVVRLSVMFSLTTFMILHQAPDLLPIFAVFVVAFAVVSTILSRRLRPFSKASAAAAAAQVARLVDSVSNWESVRSFAKTEFERAGLRPFNEAELAAQVRLRFAASRRRVTLHVLSVVFLAVLAWHAFDATRAGTLTVGGFTTIITLSILVATNIRTLGDNVFALFEQYGLLTDGIATLLTPHEVVDAPGAKPLQVKGGAIVIEDMTFGYADGTTVFARFSLSIRAGERIGLVGASGAGKSTLVKLIRRQFPLRAGRILVDGQNITDVTWDSLHEAFGEVPQNPNMFHRSVRDNIRYSRPEAGEAEVIDAAKKAHCHEFVVGRPKGYESIVGEKGMKLSGGERQRVAIARAFLKNAPILILDEATSSLDSEAEHLIQDGLLKLMEGRTVIAIAHRLSTIMHLDRIVVLEDGRVVEDGDHATLLARSGVYARLWQRQAGGFM
ncbi:MAG: ABC transporter ATP-binding protein/permease [Rhodospirillaceae bacterium]|nr:ABC transporter ATP-binding protein/permease [Rhodospirillaceae bacterium]